MFSVLSCTVALLMVSQALSAPLGISETSPHKRQLDTSPVCVTYHDFSLAPADVPLTACGQTLAEIRASARPYVSLPRAEFDAHKTATWPNPLCGREVEITSVDNPDMTVVAMVMDSNDLSGTQTQCKDKNGNLYGPVSLDVEETVFTNQLGATVAAGKGVITWRYV